MDLNNYAVVDTRITYMTLCAGNVTSECRMNEGAGAVAQ